MDKHTSKNNPFKVPEDYFNQLHNQIMGRVVEEGLREKVTTDGFSVPPGYFDALNEHIMNAAVPVKKLHSRRWIPYAAAACVTLALGTFAFWKFPKKENNSFEQHIAAISDTEIINYLQYYSEAGDGAALSEQVNIDPVNYGDSYSQEDIENYLKQTL